MKLSAFLEAMERIAPASLARDFDNVGLLVGTRKEEIHRVLVALECTNPVAREAAEWGADLVLTHHPMFIRPVKRICPKSPDTAAAYTLIENGIGLFAAHTNLDAANGGVNDTLCRVLGLTNVQKTVKEPLMRIGSLLEPQSLRAFASHCERTLSATALISGEPDRILQTAAVIGGTGGDAVSLVHELGVDALVTGEAKHHEALAAKELGVSLVVLGHYQTEVVVLESLISRLQQDDFDVQYKISRNGRAPFARP